MVFIGTFQRHDNSVPIRLVWKNFHALFQQYIRMINEVLRFEMVIWMCVYKFVIFLLDVRKIVRSESLWMRIQQNIFYIANIFWNVILFYAQRMIFVKIYMYMPLWMFWNWKIWFFLHITIVWFLDKILQTYPFWYSNNSNIKDFKHIKKISQIGI